MDLFFPIKGQKRQNFETEYIVYCEYTTDVDVDNVKRSDPSQCVSVWSIERWMVIRSGLLCGIANESYLNPLVDFDHTAVVSDHTMPRFDYPPDFRYDTIILEHEAKTSCGS